MKQINCLIGPCTHADTGLDLVPGEMTVTDAAAEKLIAIGYAEPFEKKGKARKPARNEEE